MDTESGWVIFSAQMDENELVSTRVYFAAIADRDAALAAAGEVFDSDPAFDPDSTDAVPIDQCNDKLKELARDVQPGEVKLISTIDPLAA